MMARNPRVASLLLFLAAACLGLVDLAVATGHSVPATRAAVMAALRSRGAPVRGVPADFECAWRALAMEYAAALQPFRPLAALRDIHDGLELGTMCNVSFEAAAARRGGGSAQLSQPVPRAPVPAAGSAGADASAGTTVYVDPVAGSDSNSGSEAMPYEHLAFAVEALRGAPRPGTAVLRGAGVHRLAAALALDARDSGLSIVAFPGETPVVSGGAVLSTVWHPAAPPPRPAATLGVSSGGPGGCPPGSAWVTHVGVDAMWGDWPSPGVHNLSVARTDAACAAACAAYEAAPCTAWIWYAPAGAFGPEWDSQCFVRTDGAWEDAPQHDTYSGRCEVPPPPPNVWVADLAAGGSPLPPLVTAPAFALTLLSSPDGGRSTARGFRARYPNANLETDLFPTGWASGGTRLPPPADMNTTVLHTALPGACGGAMWCGVM